MAEELQETPADVKSIILGGLLNENAVELYRRYPDGDGEEGAEEIVPDNSSEPYHLFMKGELHSRLWNAFENLDYEEQTMLSQHFGFCPEYHGVFYMNTA